MASSEVKESTTQKRYQPFSSGTYQATQLIDYLPWHTSQFDVYMNESSALLLISEKYFLITVQLAIFCYAVVQRHVIMNQYNNYHDHHQTVLSSRWFQDV